jgi:SelR domain
MKEVDKIQKNAPGKMATSEVELREKLTPEQFHVTQEHGTERAFSHPYYKDKRDGMYRRRLWRARCSAPIRNPIRGQAGRVSLTRQQKAL